MVEAEVATIAIKEDSFIYYTWELNEFKQKPAAKTKLETVASDTFK